MNNRGISPLIATVLIIGFTVALAAVIMTWGSNHYAPEVEEKPDEDCVHYLYPCFEDYAMEFCMDKDYNWGKAVGDFEEPLISCLGWSRERGEYEDTFFFSPDEIEKCTVPCY